MASIISRRRQQSEDKTVAVSELAAGKLMQRTRARIMMVQRVSVTHYLENIDDSLVSGGFPLQKSCSSSYECSKKKKKKAPNTSRSVPPPYSSHPHRRFFCSGMLSFIFCGSRGPKTIQPRMLRTAKGGRLLRVQQFQGQAVVHFRAARIETIIFFFCNNKLLAGSLLAELLLLPGRTGT